MQCRMVNRYVCPCRSGVLTGDHPHAAACQHLQAAVDKAIEERKAAKNAASRSAMAGSAGAAAMDVDASKTKDQGAPAAAPAQQDGDKPAAPAEAPAAPMDVDNASTAGAAAGGPSSSNGDQQQGPGPHNGWVGADTGRTGWMPAGEPSVDDAGSLSTPWSWVVATCGHIPWTLYPSGDALLCAVAVAGKYELCGVLTHKGRSADSGHYTSWIKQSGEGTGRRRA